jgi:hypothetical protein
LIISITEEIGAGPESGEGRVSLFLLAVLAVLVAEADDWLQ